MVKRQEHNDCIQKSFLVLVIFILLAIGCEKKTKEQEGKEYGIVFFGAKYYEHRLMPDDPTDQFVWTLPTEARDFIDVEEEDKYGYHFKYATVYYVKILIVDTEGRTYETVKKKEGLHVGDGYYNLGLNLHKPKNQNWPEHPRTKDGRVFTPGRDRVESIRITIGNSIVLGWDRNDPEN